VLGTLSLNDEPGILTLERKNLPHLDDAHRLDGRFNSYEQGLPIRLGQHVGSGERCGALAVSIRDKPIVSQYCAEVNTLCATASRRLDYLRTQD
jgi:hypothetical protein